MKKKATITIDYINWCRNGSMVKSGVANQFEQIGKCFAITPFIKEIFE